MMATGTDVDMNPTARHVVLTGAPGGTAFVLVQKDSVGKTTLVHKVCQILKQRGIRLQGFYTEEQRERGRRIGFDVVTLDGQRGKLARTSEGHNSGSRQQCSVGQYMVEVEDFEKIALPALLLQKDEAPVYVIDEIGKMEMFSRRFIKSVSDILASSNFTVFATIPIKRQNPIRFVEEIRNRKDVQLFEILKDNRDSVLDAIVETIETVYKRQKMN